MHFYGLLLAPAGFARRAAARAAEAGKLAAAFKRIYELEAELAVLRRSAGAAGVVVLVESRSVHMMCSS